MNNSCYFLSWKDSKEGFSAFAPSNSKYGQDLIHQLQAVDKMPFEFDLRYIIEQKDGLQISEKLPKILIWEDYLPNNLAWPLMSDKMKSVVINNLTGEESISWITAIIHAGHYKRIYNIPHFEKKLDVLDIENTTFVNGTDHIIRPCFAINKIKCYSMFHKPTSYDLWSITSGLYINSQMKSALKKERISGVSFSEVFTK